MGRAPRPRAKERTLSLVTLGLEVLLRDGVALPGRGRVGLLCNNAVTDRALRPTPDLLNTRRDLKLERIFSPQHGFAGEKQDNMVESGDGLHPSTGVPMVSLYGRVREPEPSMLEGLDAIVIDLPDVGTRVYTFLTTALYVMRQAARAGLPVIVLDRPNPIGDAVEGPMLSPDFHSFVGAITVPLRHGMTVGEYCRFGAREWKLDLDLRVIAMEAYDPNGYFETCGLPWIMPSPNMPTLETAVVYPGGVMLEGVNLSEGRGTTRPFELFGAPWADPPALAQAVGAVCRDAGLGGFALREVAFDPTFHKFRGETVRGFQLHVTERRAFRPVATYAAIFAAFLRVHPDHFAWREPPYEYEVERLPIDLIAGTDRLRRDLTMGASVPEIEEAWAAEVAAYLPLREAVRLYH
ncbi:MAG: DUF1343 domain-containing protein [Candidatus Eisenbacteria bacterium]